MNSLRTPWRTQTITLRDELATLLATGTDPYADIAGHHDDVSAGQRLSAAVRSMREERLAQQRAREARVPLRRHASSAHLPNAH